MEEAEDIGPLLKLSKRGARRLIQRAFVLAGRDKHLRQSIREAHITTRWVLEDWNLVWTVVLDRGKILFERRPARKPDLTLSWRASEQFFQQAEDGTFTDQSFDLDGKLELRRLCEPLLRGFFKCLARVLRNPVDETGESLL
jgi:hypothetical protein